MGPNGRPTRQRSSEEDPLVMAMLTTHMHCGDVMQLVEADDTSDMLPEGQNDDGLLTYRCACGFRFDQPRD